MLHEQSPKLFRYLIGATSARLGDEMIAPAVLLLALAVPGSAVAGPVVVAALTAAAAIGGPLFGALLDRSAAPGRLIAAALAGTALGIGAVGLLLGRIPLPHVLAVALVVGLLRPAVSSGWSSRLPTVVEAHRLARAATWDGVTFDVGAFLGPALVGLLVIVGTPEIALGVAVLLIMAATPPAWMLGGRAHCSGSLAPLFAGLRAAVQAIVRIRRLRRATLVSVISYVGMGIFGTSLPLLSRDVLDSADLAPLLVAGLAASGLVANLVISFRSTAWSADRLLLVTVCLLASSFALAAAAAPVNGGAAIALVLIATVATGLADGPQLVALLRIRHREAPAAFRAQIFTTAASLKITGYALGAAISGRFAAWSLPAVLVIASGCQLIAVICYLAHGRRKLGQ